jgi:hypothetical protein
MKEEYIWDSKNRKDTQSNEESEIIVLQPIHYKAFDALVSSLLFLFLFSSLSLIVFTICGIPAFAFLYESLNITLPFPTKLLVVIFKQTYDFLGPIFLFFIIVATVFGLKIRNHFIAQARKDFFLAFVNLGRVFVTGFMFYIVVWLLDVFIAFIWPFLLQLSHNPFLP